MNGWKRFMFSLCALFGALMASGQILTPVTWDQEMKLLEDNKVELTFTATVDEGWHLYAQDIDEGGPVPTSFNFDKLGEGVELQGAVKELSKAISKKEPVFDNMTLTYFENEAKFSAVLSYANNVSAITGYIEFMVCDDKQCLAPTEEDIYFALNDEGNASVQNEGQFNVDLGGGGQSQLLDPVNWTLALEPQPEKDEYLLRASAVIEEGWHINQMYLPLESMFIATGIEFDSEGVELLGKATADHEPHDFYDETSGETVGQFSGQVSFEQRFRLSGKESVKGVVIFQSCDDEKCLPPAEEYFHFKLSDGAAITEEAVADNSSLSPFLINSVDLDNPVADCGSEPEKSSTGWQIFLLGFFGGLIALLTPCVFPMIPLTVSFFTKSSQDRKKGIFNAIIYGFFIFLIYVLLSLPFHVMDSLDPHILNTISTNVYLNVFFFAIFIFFAFSFFGFYEITLPSSLANKVDSASNIGGLVGIFFMALTLALVSFSCTGPILGSLLAGSLSSDGGAIQLTLGMGGFGLALALPFALFAMFPGWMNALPSSGGWLNTVKVVLGFLELGMAFKFLSNADLVEHWGLLKREVFFSVWIIVGVGLALYLFGKIKFPHDSPVNKLGKGRIAFGLLVVAFVLYLVPGLTNTEHANRKLLSGFPPPLYYSIYDRDKDCPLGLDCFRDYDAGMAFARENNRPVLLDFTGYACVNCRRMEENVWVDPEVYKRIDEEFVLISLYVDDRQELPEEQKTEYVAPNGKLKRIKTVGNKWSTLQTETFGINAQPWYVLLSPDEKLLSHPVGYTPEEQKYIDFLDCGLEANKSLVNSGEVVLK